MRSDAEIALGVYRAELESVLAIITDRHVTRSIGAAVQTDGNVLTVVQPEAQLAGNEREISLRLGGQGVTLADDS